MKDVGAIFLHHDTAPRTLNNLAVLRHYNPGLEIVPVSWWGETLPGGFNAKNMGRWRWRHYRPQWFNRCDWKTFPRRLVRGIKRSYFWRNGDLPIYLWRSSQKNVNVKRWLIMEWDVFCNVEVRQFYESVWDADIAGANVHTDSNSNWQWFWPENKRRYPPQHQAHMTGISMLAGILISDRALVAICEALLKDPSWWDTFCEVRIASVAKMLGIQPVEIGPHAKETITDINFKAHEIHKPGVWHHVKDHDPMIPLR